MSRQQPLAAPLSPTDTVYARPLEELTALNTASQATISSLDVVYSPSSEAGSSLGDRDLLTPSDFELAVEGTVHDMQSHDLPHGVSGHSFDAAQLATAQSTAAPDASQPCLLRGPPTPFVAGSHRPEGATTRWHELQPEQPDAPANTEAVRSSSVVVSKQAVTQPTAMPGSVNKSELQRQRLAEMMERQQRAQMEQVAGTVPADGSSATAAGQQSQPAVISLTAHGSSTALQSVSTTSLDTEAQATTSQSLKIDASAEASSVTVEIDLGAIEFLTGCFPTISEDLVRFLVTPALSCLVTHSPTWI